MKNITQHYINGEFTGSIGQEKFNLVSPSTNEIIGSVLLGNEEDTRLAVAAARSAFKSYAHSSVEERKDYLQRFHDAILARLDDHTDALVKEYGGPVQMAQFLVKASADAILSAKKSLPEIEFTRKIGDAEVTRHPVGIAAHITPWNASILYFCNKAAAALASGCTVVTKPSEMSVIQTQVIRECIHEARLPAGLLNIVNGRGDVVGVELTNNPDVAKISFTGSTAVGKRIAALGAETMKRVTLELGGKSAHIVLDDAELDKAIPFILSAGFLNSGQACIAGTRILVPDNRYDEITDALRQAASHFKVGIPENNDTAIGPMVSEKQYQRVQNYILKGIEEGAEVLVGGAGHPTGLEAGNFVKPTIFINVNNETTIAREEIFGPVLCIIPYTPEQEAVDIANDSPYGLAGYVSSSDYSRAKQIANQLETGTVSINTFAYTPLAPFGGVKQSGLGRENGIYGISAYLEYKIIA